MWCPRWLVLCGSQIPSAWLSADGRMLLVVLLQHRLHYDMMHRNKNRAINFGLRHRCFWPAHPRFCGKRSKLPPLWSGGLRPWWLPPNCGPGGNPRVVRLSSEDIPGRPMVKSLLPASLTVIRTAGTKIIRALRKRAASTLVPGPSSSPSMPKPTVSPRLAPKQAEPPLQRRRLPQKTAAPAAPEQVSPAPVVLPVPASPATVAPPAPARGPGTPVVAVKKKPQPPAAKARPPPPAGPLNEVSDAMFDIAARERWAQPGCWVQRFGPLSGRRAQSANPHGHPPCMAQANQLRPRVRQIGRHEGCRSPRCSETAWRRSAV